MSRRCPPRRSPRRRGSPPRGRRAPRPRRRCREIATSTSSRIRFAVSVRNVVAPAPTGSRTTGRPRRSPPCREQHRVDPGRRERPDVEDERARRGGHLLDLFDGMRHDRQRADGERRVRRLVHDDVVRDLVDQRLALAEVAKRGARRVAHRPLRRWNTSTGPSPAPSSASPCATASLAVAAATIAAASTSSPRASSAVTVAECVQPEPCVAPRRVADRDLERGLAVEELVSRAAARDDRRAAPSSTSRCACSAGSPLRRARSPRPRSASPPSPAGSGARRARRLRRPRAASLPSWRPSRDRRRAARDAVEKVGDGLDQVARRRASRSSPRRRRCRRRRLRAAR